MNSNEPNNIRLLKLVVMLGQQNAGHWNSRAKHAVAHLYTSASRSWSHRDCPVGTVPPRVVVPVPNVAHGGPDKARAETNEEAWDCPAGTVPNPAPNRSCDSKSALRAPANTRTGTLGETLPSRQLCCKPGV